MNEVELPFSKGQRAALAALSDAVIPRVGDMPSATEADPSGRFLARVLAEWPDVVPVLAELAEKMDGTDPVDEAERLERDEPEKFGSLVLTIQAAYYINRKVLKRLGWSGREPAPIHDDEAERYLSGNLLDPVINRGSIYRPTPTPSEGDVR